MHTLYHFISDSYGPELTRTKPLSCRFPSAEDLDSVMAGYSPNWELHPKCGCIHLSATNVWPAGSSICCLHRPQDRLNCRRVVCHRGQHSSAIPGISTMGTHLRAVAVSDEGS